MSAPPGKAKITGGYRLDVANFGPIVKASVDLRPLTVFVGPSNTGKSYLAILIYALHRCFEDLLRQWSLAAPMFSASRLSPSLRNSLTDWLTDWFSTEGPSPTLPENLETHIRKALEKAEGLDQALEQEIGRCFGIDRLDKLVRRPGSHRVSRIDLHVPQNEGTVQYQLKFGPQGTQLSGEIPETIPLTPQIPPKDRKDPLLFKIIEDAKVDANDLRHLFRLSRDLFNALLQPLSQKSAYYLPADRTGVMHSHQVVVSALVQSAAMAGLRPSRDVPMLSGVLADFLNQLIGISARRGIRRFHQKSSSKFEAGLEHNILKGKILLEPSEMNYPTFAYRPEGWQDDLPLMRASSMVSELAPVVLYLRHIIRPGDVLIIEEPEAHLHPAMQAAFARELARLVRKGVRVVMTTHSEWFLEQIGNLVQLSTLPKERQTGLADADVALSTDEVGAWLFKSTQRPKGSIVKQVLFDPETGLYPTDYESVSETLYNESAVIFNRRQESIGQ